MTIAGLIWTTPITVTPILTMALGLVSVMLGILYPQNHGKDEPGKDEK
jgi:hypothetical protein